MAKKTVKKEVEKVVEETPKKVKEVEVYDPKFCAKCGLRLNVVASKFDGLNFCSIDCYNAMITN